MACSHVKEKPSPDFAISQPGTIFSSPQCSKEKKSTLMIHGGAGYQANETQKRIIKDILAQGHQMLRAGYSSLDVVQYAVEQMENSGHFNAGRAGTRTAIKTVELDAAIMDGKDLSAGAVASVKDVKNPIRLARAVKEKTRHVLIVGEGASEFADQLKYEKVTPTYFVSDFEIEKKNFHYGTVGAIAMDRCKNFAAATSTGGLYGKMPGRVGDSPLIGSGTYANNKTGAISCTGSGEKFIRANVASRISNILQYTKRNLKSALQESLEMVEQMQGDGGVIAISLKGEPEWATTPKTPLVAGFVQEDGLIQVR